MVILKNGLIVIKDGQLGDIFRLKNIVRTWMVHIMRSSRNEGDKDVEARQVACFLEALDFYELRQVLGDVCGVHLGMIRIVSIRLLQSECQVFDSHLVHSLPFINIFPIEFVITVHDLEVEEIIVNILIDQICIISVLQEVLIVGFQLGAV